MPSQILTDIFARQSKYQDSLVAAFEDELRDVVLKAQGATIAKLQTSLKLDEDGAILDTAANQKALNKLGAIFSAELKKAGYNNLVHAFVAEFDGTLPYLDKIINALGKQVQKKWKLDFSKTDLNVLSGQQQNIAAALTDTVSQAATTAMTRSLFSLGGLRFEGIVKLLSDQIGKSISQARTVAETGVSVFYATATDRAFQQIEKDVASQVETPKYVYAGPDDKLTRPFCEALLKKAAAYTREQIQKMDNHQLPNPMITRGGWNCRHVWLLDISALEVRAMEAA